MPFPFIRNIASHSSLISLHLISFNQERSREYFLWKRFCFIETNSFELWIHWPSHILIYAIVPNGSTISAILSCFSYHFSLNISTLLYIKTNVLPISTWCINELVKKENALFCFPLNICYAILVIRTFFSSPKSG